MGGNSKERKSANIVGVVTRNQCMNTIHVRVNTKKKHKKYHKYVSVGRLYATHIESNDLVKEGDRVAIISCRPISRNKFWKFVEKLN